MLLFDTVIGCTVTIIAGFSIVRNIKHKKYMKALIIALGLAILYVRWSYLLIFFISA